MLARLKSYTFQLRAPRRPPRLISIVSLTTMDVCQLRNFVVLTNRAGSVGLPMRHKYTPKPASIKRFIPCDTPCQARKELSAASRSFREVFTAYLIATNRKKPITRGNLRKGGGNASRECPVCTAIFQPLPCGRVGSSRDATHFDSETSEH